jgi:DNA-directed RNA polymerase subunit RPC12/RpoP
MGALSFRCPKTTLPIKTAIETDYKNLARSWNETMRVRCPHCSGHHDVKVREAFISNAISERMLHGDAPDEALDGLAERMTAGKLLHRDQPA